jgi:hypothetical protein
MQMHDEIEEATFAIKQTELRDRFAKIKLQLDVANRNHGEFGELAVKMFELLQIPCQQ